MALSSDAALKNPLKGLMLSMQLLLNAREEDLGVEFKIVTKILNRELSVFLTLFYTVLCPALSPSRRNLAYRHTSSSDLNTRFQPNHSDGWYPSRREMPQLVRREGGCPAQDQETGRRKES